MSIAYFDVHLISFLDAVQKVMKTYIPRASLDPSTLELSSCKIHIRIVLT